MTYMKTRKKKKMCIFSEFKVNKSNDFGSQVQRNNEYRKLLRMQSLMEEKGTMRLTGYWKKFIFVMEKIKQQLYNDWVNEGFL